MEFTHYYGKYKHQNRRVAQNIVPQRKCYPVIRARVNVELEAKILEVAEEKRMSVSEMTRKLWEDYLEKKFQKEWKAEVSEY